MSEEKTTRKKGGLIGKLIGLIIILVVIFLILMFFGKNIGFDLGGMLGFSGTTDNAVSQETAGNQGSKTTDPDASGNATELSGTVKVRVSESDIYVNDEKIGSVADLTTMAAGAQEGTIFEITDDGAIKETYDSVAETLKAAGVSIKQ